MPNINKPKTRLSAYKQQAMFGGWTRVDMLLAIYDRAINSLEAVTDSQKAGRTDEIAVNLLACQKAILAIHAGLKPDENDIAFNIARLLHFVLQCIENENFADAIKVLSNLREGFAAIQEEAYQLEKRGIIPPLETTAQFTAQI